MKKRSLTWLFVLLTFLAIVVYDVLMYMLWPQATISGLTDEAAAKYPGAIMGVCLAIGYLLGHLFWVQRYCPHCLHCLRERKGPRR